MQPETIGLIFSVIAIALPIVVNIVRYLLESKSVSVKITFQDRDIEITGDFDKVKADLEKIIALTTIQNTSGRDNG
jgi:hypothetical protein